VSAYLEVPVSVSVDRRSPYRLGERVREKESGLEGVVIGVFPDDEGIEVAFIYRNGGSRGPEGELEPFDFEDERERARD
jgi:hypothetical protein